MGDKKSGRPYYVSLSGGKSVWKLPTGAEVIDDRQDEAPKGVAEGMSKRKRHRRKRHSKQHRIANKIAESSVGIGEGVWKLPAGAEVIDDPHLKYAQKIDKKSGRPYYVSLSGGKSVWKLPRGAEVIDDP